MMQRTIKGCGLDAVVPTRAHPDDEVICEDGWICKHSEALWDCKGRAWGAAGLCHDANVEVVTDLLNGVDEWVTEYCTGNTDYASAYDHIVNETSHDWPDIIERWVRDHYGDRMGHTEFDDRMDEVVKSVCEELDGGYDCEAHYQRSDYDCWHGPGCCLWSTDIGEHEEQIEIASYPELQDLHDRGILDDVLDDVNCDVHVSRDRRRVKNEETGRYEYVGRETYDRGNGHPYLMTYHMVPGCWHWVVDEERMNELVDEALDGEED